MSLITDLLERLKREEGLRLRAYRDTLGHLTIGYGTLLERADIDARLRAMGLSPTMLRACAWPITEAQATELLDYDAQAAITDAGDVVGREGWQRLDERAKLVLADLMYNIGMGGVQGFHKMLAAIRSEPPNYLGAAYELRNSTWHHQVGQRARDLEELMRSCAPAPPEPDAAA